MLNTSGSKAMKIIVAAFVVLTFSYMGRNFLDGRRCEKARTYINSGYTLYINGEEANPEHVTLWDYRHEHISFDTENKEIRINDV